MGSNAIHAAAPILARLAAYEPRTIAVDGLDYRESLNAVKINGGTAGNVIPDSCVVEINYRFAPDKTPDDAEAHVRELLAGFDVVRTDAAAGARPGLHHPAAASFVAAVGAEPKPKYGWTDVARFSELGIPAVNFGPGDALLAHKDNDTSRRTPSAHACGRCGPGSRPDLRTRKARILNRIRALLSRDASDSQLRLPPQVPPWQRRRPPSWTRGARSRLRCGKRKG